MAELGTAPKLTITGSSPTFVSAGSGAGDTFSNNGEMVLWVKNASIGDIVVTVEIKKTVAGQSVVDPTITVAAGGEKLIAGLSPEIYNDPSTGKVTVTYSATSSVTVAVVQMQKATALV